MSKRNTGAASSGGEIRASVIVPTYKEGANIRPLTERLFAALPSSGKINSGNVELIFVDDNSRDGSAETVESLKTSGYCVRIIVRTTERGLSSAVIRGFEEAQGDLLMCMDADLQHPPEVVPTFLNSLDSRESNVFVSGTRYAKGQGGVDKDWPLYRRVISEGARALSRPLTPLSDPMSGLFVIRRAVYKRGKDINPIGFKIALELYVKCGCTASGLVEEPFLFGVRTAGESKLTGKVIIKYVEQLVQLYWHRFPVLSLLFLLLLLVTGAAVAVHGAELAGFKLPLHLLKV